MNVRMKDENAMIQIRQLSFSYDPLGYSVPALTNINLNIHKGEWLAIIGHNGSGKSTLAKILAGLALPPEREMIHHMDSGNEPLVQMVFQNPESQIVGETVYEDIVFGMENYRISQAEMSERARAALAQCGLNCSFSKSTSQLSGGQKQLLAIAGCLAIDAPILVFDEATSMLDPLARGQVLLVLQKLHRLGKTIVWITQLLEELAFAERVIALEHGTVKYIGSAMEFFYYRTDLQDESPCESLGYIAPYSVRVANSLIRSGISLAHLPISPAQLGQAVGSLWR